jgi:two-component sensor histidine kinase/CHASE3 domain sensor protein
MSISGKVVVNSTIGLLSLGLLFLIGIMTAAGWLSEREQYYSRMAVEARESRIAAVELRSALQTAESSQRGFLVAGNEIYLAPYSSAKARSDAYFRKLKAALQNEESDRLLQRLSRLIEDKYDEMDRTIALKREYRDQDAEALFSSNRGKAIMDEANLFLSSIIRKTDEKLNAGLLEQGRNTIWLRWVSILGGLAIVLLVGGAIATIYRYTHEVATARDELQSLTSGLELRVQERTSQLAKARDKAEILLSEVNHRVANSLAIVSSLVRLQAGQLSDATTRNALNEVQSRIDAIAAVHRHLYKSGDASFVEVEAYVSMLLDNIKESMRSRNAGISLSYDLDAMKLTPDSSINLGVIVTEWVTNAYKYAYPDQKGEVRIRLKRRSDGRAELVVEDDGVGSADGGAPKGSGMGTRIVKAMGQMLNAEIDYFARKPGFAARAAFDLPLESA